MEKVGKVLSLKERNASDLEEIKEKQRWKLDKQVPIAVIMTILLQSFAGIWWLSGLEHSVQDHERRIIAQESIKVAERMAVVEMEMKENHELQLEMNRKLDRLMSFKRAQLHKQANESED